MIEMISRLFRRPRIERLLKKAAARRIRVHSVQAADGACGPDRVAFEFIDPPGPWSMQFYEAMAGQKDILAELIPGASAHFFESNDGAQTRVLRTAEGKILWPR